MIVNILRTFGVCLILCMVNTDFFLFGQETKLESAETPPTGSENDRDRYARKLLQFAERNPRSQLSASMAFTLAQEANADEATLQKIERELQADALDSIRYDRQLKSLNRIAELKQSTRDATTSARARAVRTEINAMILQLQKRSAEVAFERRALRAENKIKGLKETPIAPLQAATGNPQNTLLKSMQSRLTDLRDGYSLSSSETAPYLSQLTLSDEDLSRIRLKFLTEAGWIEFPLTVGSGQLMTPPFLLRQSSLLKMAEAIEQQFKNLAKLDGKEPEFVIQTRQMVDSIAKFENTVVRELGDRQSAGKRGRQYLAKWMQVQEYITGLNALINNLELTNNTSILRNRNRYDPKVYGNDVLALATFCIVNSCEFASAGSGDEASYVRLHGRLLQLHNLLEAW